MEVVRETLSLLHIYLSSVCCRWKENIVILKTELKMNNKVILRVFRYFRDEGKFGINIFSPADNIKLYDSWI